MVKPDPMQWLAVMDLSVTRNSPAGSCVLAEIEGLAAAGHTITVFSDAFDGVVGERVRWVRIPLPVRPGILRYVFFHLQIRRALAREVAFRGRAPLRIQATQGQFVGADICYAHFCHRAYLQERWSQQDARGWRRVLRWAGYKYNSWFERRAFVRASNVVVPSVGLAKEIIRFYPFLEACVRVISNPVDVDLFACRDHAQSIAVRERLGIPQDVPTLAFAALGDFSRKGLSLVLEAQAKCIAYSSTHLVVIGGTPSEVRRYQSQADNLGLHERVHFVGFQADIRPYLWLSDLFVFPSSYETFALVVLQAMAAGLPVIVTRLHGVEEYVRDGDNGLIVDRDSIALQGAIERALGDPDWMQCASRSARQEAEKFDRERFTESWTSFYAIK